MSQVEQFLACHPSAIQESNIDGETPLHLAADKPEYLQLLVRFADDRALNRVNSARQSPADYALYLSGNNCRAGGDELCDPQCPCTSCLDILFHADCTLPITAGYSLTLSLALVCFNYGSKRGRLKYVSALEDRRERLKNLALQHLPPSQAKEFGLMDEKVLDACAFSVARQLEDQNIAIPAALVVLEDNTSMQTTNPGAISIYQRPLDVSGADLFFDLGFRDLNTVDVNGFPPLAVYYNFQSHISASYLLWLVEHGAQLLYRLEITGAIHESHRIRGTTSAHWVLLRLGSVLLPENEVELNLYEKVAIDQLNAKVLPVNAIDECCCRCSLGGCTPFLWTLKGMLRFIGRVREYARILSEYIQHFGSHMRAQHHREAIRFVTSEALSIQHTCCPAMSSDWDRCPNYDPEDVKEIEEEHATLLEILEDLVLEFEGEIGDLLESETTDAVLAALGAFWTGYWNNRMEDILRELNGCDLSAEEKIGAARIGVKWKDEAVEEKGEGFDYWCRRIEEIQ